MENAKRFAGIAETYHANRPHFPRQAGDVLLRYLGHVPSCAVDLGCGTGLSTGALAEISRRVIGVEPSEDMLAKARQNLAGNERIQFVREPAEHTGLSEGVADLIVCAQSFHWMEPAATLKEVDRLLKPGGVFSTVDYDWPGVYGWRAELAYEELIRAAEQIQRERPELGEGTGRWDKGNHLNNLRALGSFRYVREFLFCSEEECDADRYVGMALSQSGIQMLLHAGIRQLEQPVARFRDAARDCFRGGADHVLICYRMRLGIK